MILSIALGLIGFFGWWRYLVIRAKYDALKEGQDQIKGVFASMSADALEQNNRQFMTLAESILGKFHEKAKGDLTEKEKAIDHLVRPVQETLTKLDQEMRAMEKERKGDTSAIRTQVENLIATEKALKTETSNLVKALRAPNVRGRWGELQLRRVVELAGMIKHCDFFEQTTLSNDEGVVRPDVIVQLPGAKQVIIDAKAPLDAYLDAQETENDTIRRQKLKDHARQVRQHLMALSKKNYWEHFADSPEFVVLFLPSETFFSAALEFDPSLIEVGAGQGVIIATPTTLIGLLRAVAYGWKQEAISKNAQEISNLGHELYKRLSDMSTHFGKVGKALNQSVDAFNKTIGSFESRVMVSARKFQELDVGRKDLDLTPIDFIEKVTRVTE